MMSGSPALAAVYEAVNELMTRNSPPKLGGEPARTKSEQAGWFPCRYWQLREPPRPRLRSGTPPNLGGECPHSNSFTAPMIAGDLANCVLSAVIDRRYSGEPDIMHFLCKATPLRLCTKNPGRS